MRARAIADAILRAARLPARLPARRFLGAQHSPPPRGAAFAGDLGRGEAALVRRWGYGTRVRRRGEGRLSFLAGAIQDFRPRVVLFDAYRPMERELRLARRSGAAVVLLEEGADRGTAPVDVRIDPSVDAGRPRRGCAGGPVRPAGLRLNGLRFVCLRPEIVRLARRRRAARGAGGGRAAGGSRAVRILVTLGGGKAPGLPRLVGDLRRAVAIRPIPASSHRYRWAVCTPMARAAPGAHFLTDPPAVARAMASADVAVSAAGTTAWELACLGVPAALWVMARNQEPIARALVGRAAIVCPRRRDLPRALLRLLHDLGLRSRLSRAGQEMIDGRGAGRAAAAILRRLGGRSPDGPAGWTTASVPIRLRPFWKRGRPFRAEVSET
jgi:spore coat polysaccharide biosynthesis predicted glycosyltransferase SpsG